MSADRLRLHLEAAMLRSRVALDDGPTLDAATEYAAARQMLAELDALEGRSLWHTGNTDDGN